MTCRQSGHLTILIPRIAVKKVLENKGGINYSRMHDMEINCNLRNLHSAAENAVPHCSQEYFRGSLRHIVHHDKLLRLKILAFYIYKSVKLRSTFVCFGGGYEMMSR